MLTCSGRTCSQMNQLRECIGNEIQWLRNQGIKENLTLISNKFHCDIRIVRDVRNRINCNHSITNSYSKSTKQKITEDIGHFIEIMTIANRSISGRGLSELILQKFNVHITKTTINKYRKQIGFKYGPQIRTFILTEEQKQKRLEFAKKISTILLKMFSLLTSLILNLTVSDGFGDEKMKKHQMFSSIERHIQPK